MNAIAIIPARGGSKRIPRKNIKEFCGRPIIEYSIKAALESGVFNEVMVSTDDREIAAIAESAGAKVPFFRSEETANDRATIDDAVNEVLERYARQGMSFDHYAVLYATAPMIQGIYIKEAFQTLEHSHGNFVLPVVRFSYPPQRSFSIENGDLKWNYPEYRQTRTQDLPIWYHDCGMFEVGRVDNGRVIPSANRIRIPYIMPEEVVQDIDTEEDWRIAEMKYRIVIDRSNLQ